MGLKNIWRIFCIVIIISLQTQVAFSTRTFHNGSPLVAGPRNLTIEHDTYVLERGARLVSYYKETGGRIDRGAPHITMEGYDETNNLLTFHVTGTGETGHDVKYEYNARDKKLVGLEQLRDIGQLRRINISAPRAGFTQADQLANGFVEALDQEYFH